MCTCDVLAGSQQGARMSYLRDLSTFCSDPRFNEVKRRASFTDARSFIAIGREINESFLGMRIHVGDG